MRKILFVFSLLFVSITSEAQYDDDMDADTLMGIIDTSIINKYNFIHYAHNKFYFPSEESPNFEYFYSKFDSLINRRKGQVVVYHMGGSHIQADVYSNKMRTWMNSYWPGLKGARGLVFPYTIAGTNNPYNYKSEGTGEWTSLRCVQRKDTSRLGIEGISISCKDSISSIKIYYREKEPMPYRHDRFRIYHNMNPSFMVEFGYPSIVKSVMKDSLRGFTEFNLSMEFDTAFFVITRVKSDTSSFTCYGVEMMNKQPGVIYNSIGVNGAALPNYLRCQDWEMQLKNLPPDLFILSVGTNDANVPDGEFDTLAYFRNYEEITKKILRANPNCAILYTVPNDAYYYKKHPNRNVALTRNVIIDLSKKYNMGFWDVYEMMGGLGSSNTWYKADLMHKDRIHFTWDGYLLKGDLFFEAFLKYLDEYEYKRLVKLTNEK